MRNILGVITARGGSKGIPGKNIKELCGKPLISYIIDAAKKSGVFDRIIISTDDKEIADVASRWGAEVPFMRPAELARDATATLPVIQHAVKWLKEKENYWPDYAAVLQPTSPLVQPFHFKEAAELILTTGADSVLSVSEIPENYSPCNAMLIEQDGFLRLFNGQPIYKRIARRQDRPKTYHSAGLLYFFKTELLFDEKEPNFYGEKVAPLIIDSKYAVDINVPVDWEIAEAAIKKIQSGTQ